GEKMLDVYKRMQNAILKIVQENRGKTIVISSHGCAIRNYLCFAMFGTIEKIYDVPWQENTAISKIEFDDLIPKVIYAGRCTHLSDDQKTIFNQNWQKKQKM
ncbi:MAG: histidine phosphatase family protein, partial [Oscillospiraceae bacterium]